MKFLNVCLAVVPVTRGAFFSRTSWTGTDALARYTEAHVDSYEPSEGKAQVDRYQSEAGEPTARNSSEDYVNVQASSSLDEEPSKDLDSPGLSNLDSQETSSIPKLEPQRPQGQRHAVFAIDPEKSDPSRKFYVGTVKSDYRTTTFTANLKTIFIDFACREGNMLVKTLPGYSDLSFKIDYRAAWITRECGNVGWVLGEANYEFLVKIG